MHYSALAALVFGSSMYALGYYQAKNSINSLQNSISQLQMEIPRSRIAIQSFAAGKNSEKDIEASKIAQDITKFEGVESITRNLKLNQSCAIYYSTLHRAPLAVHQALNKKMLEGNADRDDTFWKKNPVLAQKEEDKMFFAKDNFYTDTHAYKNLNYSRGHMAPAADYNFNQDFKNSTFTFANAIPQHKNNNTGIWLKFQKYSRNLLKNDICDTVQVISGPVYHSNQPHPSNLKDVYEVKYNVLKENGIMAPPKLYKIIKCNKGGKSYASGFVFQNADPDKRKRMSEYQVSLNKIEEMTGLHFKFKNKVSSLSQVDMIDETGHASEQKSHILSFIQMSEDTENMNLCSDDYPQRFETLASKQFQQIKKQTELKVCQRLNDQLSLYKNLLYSKTLDKLKADLENSISNQLTSCLNSEDQETIKSIKNKMEDSLNRQPHNQFIKNLMTNFKEEISQEN